MDENLDRTNMSTTRKPLKMVDRTTHPILPSHQRLRTALTEESQEARKARLRELARGINRGFLLRSLGDESLTCAERKRIGMRLIKMNEEDWGV